LVHEHQPISAGDELRDLAVLYERGVPFLHAL